MRPAERYMRGWGLAACGDVPVPGLEIGDCSDLETGCDLFRFAPRVAFEGERT